MTLLLMVQILPSGKTTITTIYMMYRCCEEKMMKSCDELMMKITNGDDIFSYQILIVITLSPFSSTTSWTDTKTRGINI